MSSALSICNTAFAICLLPSYMFAPRTLLNSAVWFLPDLLMPIVFLFVCFIPIVELLWKKSVQESLEFEKNKSPPPLRKMKIRLIYCLCPRGTIQVKKCVHRERIRNTCLKLETTQINYNKGDSSRVVFFYLRFAHSR